MSGLRSRRKGHNFERQVADDYRTRWPAATVRRSSQGDGAHEPDVVIEGEAPATARRLWTECQCALEPTPLAKLQQAERDCAVFTGVPWLPVVVWHKTRERTTWVTLRLGTLSRLELVGMPPIHGVTAASYLVVTLDFAAFLMALP